MKPIPLFSYLWQNKNCIPVQYKRQWPRQQGRAVERGGGVEKLDKRAEEAAIMCLCQWLKTEDNATFQQNTKDRAALEPVVQKLLQSQPESKLAS